MPVAKLSFEEEAFAFVAVVLGGPGLFGGVFRTGSTSPDGKKKKNDVSVWKRASRVFKSLFGGQSSRGTDVGVNTGMVLRPVGTDVGVNTDVAGGPVCTDETHTDSPQSHSASRVDGTLVASDTGEEEDQLLVEVATQTNEQPTSESKSPTPAVIRTSDFSELFTDVREPRATDNGDFSEVFSSEPRPAESLSKVTSSLRGCLDANGELTTVGDYREFFESAKLLLSTETIDDAIAALRSTVQECLVAAYIGHCKSDILWLPMAHFFCLQDLRAAILKKHPHSCAEEHDKWDFLFKGSFTRLTNWFKTLPPGQVLDEISQNISAMSDAEISIYSLPAPVLKLRKPDLAATATRVSVADDRVPVKSVESADSMPIVSTPEPKEGQLFVDDATKSITAVREVLVKSADSDSAIMQTHPDQSSLSDDVTLESLDRKAEVEEQVTQHGNRTIIEVNTNVSTTPPPIKSIADLKLSMKSLDTKDVVRLREFVADSVATVQKETTLVRSGDLQTVEALDLLLFTTQHIMFTLYIDKKHDDCYKLMTLVTSLVDLRHAIKEKCEDAREECEAYDFLFVDYPTVFRYLDCLADAEIVKGLNGKCRQLLKEFLISLNRVAGDQQVPNFMKPNDNIQLALKALEEESN